ncbi:MAG: HK97 family phage prohead protease [Chloroflexi bacterium]|nr:HK97 family phage prohead protease [Chloroflexota bacterium]
MDTKTLTAPIELMEDGPEGAVVARIATLGVVDRDGDLTVPGAFGSVDDVKVSPFNHSSAYGAALPVGVGKVFERGGAAFFEGLLFLDTIGGRELHTTLKRLSEAGAPCEWSYGFEVVESEDAVRGDQRVRVLKRLALFEVSPVLRGAGIGTRTVSVKSDALRQAQGERWSSPSPQPSPIKGEGVAEAASTGSGQAERDFADLQVIEARMAGRDVLASLNTEV